MPIEGMYRGRGYKKSTSAATLFSSLAVVSYGFFIELLTRIPNLNVVPGATFWPRHRRREATQQFCGVGLVCLGLNCTTSVVHLIRTGMRKFDTMQGLPFTLINQTILYHVKMVVLCSQNEKARLLSSPYHTQLFILLNVNKMLLSSHT